MFRDRLPHLTLLRALALVAVLLLTQALGLAHGVRHARLAPASAGQGLLLQDAAGSQAGAATAPHAERVASPWGAPHTAGDVDCRLIDQLGHADAPAPGPHAGPPPISAAQALPIPGKATPPARPAAAYCARAPPH